MCMYVWVGACIYVHLNTQSLLKIILVITLILEIGLLGKAKYNFYLKATSFYSEDGFLGCFQNHKCK